MTSARWRTFGVRMRLRAGGRPGCRPFCSSAAQRGIQFGADGTLDGDPARGQRAMRAGLWLPRGWARPVQAQEWAGAALPGLALIATSRRQERGPASAASGAHGPTPSGAPLASQGVKLAIGPEGVGARMKRSGPSRRAGSGGTWRPRIPRTSPQPSPDWGQISAWRAARLGLLSSAADQRLFSRWSGKLAIA